MARKPDGRRLYKQFIGAAAASLGPDEYWVIDHDDGPLTETASKDIDHPVRVFCAAMDCDWDQATAGGFRLGRITKP